MSMNPMFYIGPYVQSHKTDEVLWEELEEDLAVGCQGIQTDDYTYWIPNRGDFGVRLDKNDYSYPPKAFGEVDLRREEDKFQFQFSESLDKLTNPLICWGLVVGVY